ncbi:MAG: methyltransferase domain-containing protein [Deltaproteobacteria bacterium]
MKLVERILGHPWIFDCIRPIAVGGIDMSSAYRRLGSDEHAVLLDVGCGTGDALRHVGRFASYLGLDTDHVALGHARARHAARAHVEFACRTCRADDFTERPVSHVSMVGLLHHLSDSEAIELLGMLRACPTLVRAVSLDIAYLDDRWYNNLLARFDRGRHCRTAEGYAELVRRAGLRVQSQSIVRSHPTRGLVDYFIMEIVL